jgi:hypothetical protein
MLTQNQITSANPRYSGKMFIEGRIPRDSPVYSAAQDIAGPGNMMALGQGKNLNVQQVADGTYRVYLGLQVEEDFQNRFCADKTSMTECMREHFCGPDFFGSWSSKLKQFVELAEGPFRLWPLYCFDPEEVGWTRRTSPGLTLLGDAGTSDVTPDSCILTSVSGSSLQYSLRWRRR